MVKMNADLKYLSKHVRFYFMPPLYWGHQSDLSTTDEEDDDKDVTVDIEGDVEGGLDGEHVEIKMNVNLKNLSKHVHFYIDHP